MCVNDTGTTVIVIATFLLFIHLILLSFFILIKRVSLYSIELRFYVLVIICQRQTTEFPFKGLIK